MDSKERRFKALDCLLDYSRGTLWWVKDWLWKEADPNFVVKRRGHPGLSISNRKAEGLYDYIPMAIGTTKCLRYCVAVKNMTDPEENGDRVTHFSVLRPMRLRFDDFGSSEGVHMNEYKPRIDHAEMSELIEMLNWGEI